MTPNAHICAFVVYGTSMTFRVFIGTQLSLHLLDTKAISNIFILPREDKSHFNNRDLLAEYTNIQYIKFHRFLRSFYSMVVYGDKLGI